jgi:hypothetical protein
MRNAWMLRGCCIVALSHCSLAIAEEWPSTAALWMQRTEVEKVGYIDGLCDGYKYLSNEPHGELSCKPLDHKGKQVRRFCSARWVFKDGMTDPMPGVRMFDQFYTDKDHSDLPTWTVIAAYNDKACGESRVLPRLPAIQAKLLCHRQLLNMSTSHFPAEAVAAQEKACNALR